MTPGHLTRASRWLNLLSTSHDFPDPLFSTYFKFFSSVREILYRTQASNLCLILVPEYRKCLLRDPNFKTCSGWHAPGLHLEVRVLAPVINSHLPVLPFAFSICSDSYLKAWDMNCFPLSRVEIIPVFCSLKCLEVLL